MSAVPPQWWDLFSQENVEGFEFLNYQATSPRCRGQMKLLMEPGGHCAGGEYTYVSRGARRSTALPPTW